jgi:lipid A ethanolaminephosphotransferase
MGRAYNTRYPASFEEYKPVCNSVQLQQCSQEELINAYDNSIRFTDHVVGQTIDLLRRLDIDATLFFIADHGESLGEGRLYLHGTPWLVAPEEQKRIPFIVWNSRDNIKENTTTKFVDGAFTQASVFHSVLGAFDMRSPVYKPELDVLPKVGRP